MIDPKFWSDDKIIELEPLSRLCFIGLWNFSDDYGIHKNNAKVIKAEIFPADDIPLQQVELMLEDLERFNLIEISKDRVLLKIKGWSIYQKINRPQPSKYAEEFDELNAPVDDPVVEEKPAAKEVKQKKKKPQRKLKTYREKVEDYYNNISDDFINDLHEAYPNVDIAQQLKESKVWLLSNTNRAKKNFDAYLNRWMAKQMEINSFSGSTVSNKETHEKQVLEKDESKRIKIEKEHDDYVEENAKNAATQEEAQLEIDKALAKLKGNRRKKHDAAINPENI